MSSSAADSVEAAPGEVRGNALVIVAFQQRVGAFEEFADPARVVRAAIVGFR